MKILVINCHTDNRGDEAAVHALVDELSLIDKNVKITLALRGAGTHYPNMPENVKMIQQFMPMSKRSQFAHKVAKITKGNVSFSSNEKMLIAEIRTANLILHAPGGPSIGDTYYDNEPTYLEIYNLILKMHKPYMFYAPSMGPFDRKARNRWRKKILNGAELITLRDPISAEHVKRLLPNKMVYQTLDSAFQHEVDTEDNKKKLYEYKELCGFLKKHRKCIGITITDLLWHPVHSQNKRIVEKVHDSFSIYLKKLVENGYGIVFIPQLYGIGDDYNLMKEYAVDDDNYIVLSDNNDRYDAYFQQYLIGQLYAVVGMRYHSNIFSAKMGTPFVSVSYEQKMQGFMNKMNIDQYCINVNELSVCVLDEKFNLLLNNYEVYKQYLINKHSDMKAEAYRATKYVKEILERFKDEDGKKRKHS